MLRLRLALRDPPPASLALSGREADKPGLEFAVAPLVPLLAPEACRRKVRENQPVFLRGRGEGSSC